VNLLAFLWFVGCTAAVAIVGILAVSVPREVWRAVADRVRNQCDFMTADYRQPALRCVKRQGHPDDHFVAPDPREAEWKEAGRG